MKRYICSIILSVLITSTLCGCSGGHGMDEAAEQSETTAVSVTGHAEIIEQSGTSYEDSLAAGGLEVLAASYTQFEPIEILTDAAHTIEDAAQSKGVYILFQSDEGEKCVYLHYLQQERTEAGTTDLFIPSIGYATMDIVDSSVINQEFEVKTMESLKTALSQILLPTVIEH